MSEPFGDAATRFMKGLLDGKLVRLEYDGERTDQYNRTLANDAIIRAGFAEAHRRFTYLWRGAESPAQV